MLKYVHLKVCKKVCKKIKNKKMYAEFWWLKKYSYLCGAKAKANKLKR